MDLMDCLRERRSIRLYTLEPVGREHIAALLEAAESAPSAGNLRARKYVVVTRSHLRDLLSKAALGQRHVASAPLLIVVCADPMRSARRYGDRGHLYAILDAASATMCILLAAHNMGLGACWNGAFYEEMVRNILDLPEQILPVAIVSIGWPSERPESPPRRDLAEVVSWEVE